MVDAIGNTDYKLLLAGEIESNIEKRLKKRPGWRQVEALGFIDRDGVRTAMAHSMVGLVLLHPTINYWDALPIKMFEYMSSGLPVISSNFPLWREIIEGAECGICVDPFDQNEITSAIHWIMERPQEAMQMGKNGRKAVEEMYNWRLVELELRRLYDKIAQ
jgi:glycosyltransferase involved in cell wall biosynthesis